MVKSYNIGPKLGDFIHALVIPKFIHETTGNKAVIYISGIGCTFTKSISDTYDELRPVLEKQDFVHDFQIYRDQKVDYELFRFRSSPLLFNAGWNRIYATSFLEGQQIPDEYQWLYLPVTFNNQTVVNRSIRGMSEQTKQYYMNLGQPLKFVCSDIQQYNNFPVPSELDLCQTLSDMCNKIAACKLFVGNQSAPLAIASAFGKKRIAELRRGPDAPHYGLEKDSNLTTFIGD